MVSSYDLALEISALYQVVTDESVDADNAEPPAPGQVNPLSDELVYKNFSNASNPFLVSLIFLKSHYSESSEDRSVRSITSP